MATKQNLHIPVALPPPRGRPAKNAGKRKRGFYERGPENPNRKPYNCSLCGLKGHNARFFSMRQGPLKDDHEQSGGGSRGD